MKPAQPDVTLRIKVPVALALCLGVYVLVFIGVRRFARPDGPVRFPSPSALAPPWPSPTPGPTANPTTTPTPTPTPSGPPLADPGRLAPGEVVHPVDGSIMVRIPGAHRSWTASAPPEGGTTRSVTLTDVHVDKYEVRNRQFSRFIEASGYRTAAELRGGSLLWNGSRWEFRKGVDWRHPLGPEDRADDRPDHPVVHVAWLDAMAYCLWAGKRLPTEGEWDSIVRADHPAGPYPWGEAPPASRAVFGVRGAGGPERVGLHPPTAGGVHDLAGNVSEPCLDWFSTGYPAVAPEVDPAGPLGEDVHPASKVFRGGSFCSVPEQLRVDGRWGLEAGHTDSATGFRTVAWEIPGGGSSPVLGAAGGSAGGPDDDPLRALAERVRFETTDSVRTMVAVADHWLRTGDRCDFGPLLDRCLGSPAIDRARYVDRGILHHVQAELRMRLEDATGAMVHYQRSVELVGDRWGGSDIPLADALMGLARCQRLFGLFEGAVENLRRSLRIAAGIRTALPRLWVRGHRELTRLEQDRAQLPVAAGVLEAMEVFAREHLDPQDPEWARLHRAAASVRRDQENPEQAVRLLNQALDLYEALRIENLEKAGTLADLADLLPTTDLAGAVERLRGALAIYGRTFPEGHSRMVWMLQRIGELLALKGDTAEARAEHARALELARKVYGPAHPLTADAKNRLDALAP